MSFRLRELNMTRNAGTSISFFLTLRATKLDLTLLMLGQRIPK